MSGMAEDGDRVDHRAALADRCAKDLRLGLRRKLLPRAGGGRLAPGRNKVRGVLQAEFFVGCQGLNGGLRSVAMAADSRRDQKRATPKSLNKGGFCQNKIVPAKPCRAASSLGSGQAQDYRDRASLRLGPEVELRTLLSGDETSGGVAPRAVCGLKHLKPGGSREEKPRRVSALTALNLTRGRAQLLFHTPTQLLSCVTGAVPAFVC